MNAAGELVVRLAWDGQRTSAVEIDLGRPQAAQLLVGKSAGEALAWVPRLFSICGQVQTEAARAALAAAGAPTAGGEGATDRILLEAAQEHLWRLLRDWPRALGLPSRDHAFAAWYRRLAALAAAPLPAEGLPDLLEFVDDLVGAEFPHLLAFDADLAAFSASSQALSATLLRALPAAGPTPAPAPRSYIDRQLPLAGPWPLGGGDSQWAERPTQFGAAAETGALARQRHVALVADGLARSGPTLAVRLVARLHDALAVARALARRSSAWADDLIASRTVAPGSEGMARADTARGILLHHVRLEGQRVAEYAIVAPTAWNFHPRGALAASLGGLVAGEEAELRALVSRWVVAVDPCVAWRLEVRRA